MWSLKKTYYQYNQRNTSLGLKLPVGASRKGFLQKFYMKNLHYNHKYQLGVENNA